MKRRMNRPMLLIAMVLLLFTEGCGVYMAFTQPPKVNQEGLEKGEVSRDYVMAQLGPPRTSTKNPDGSRTDIYEFYEGSASGWKIGRGVFHLLADVLTFGLWEIVATPTEFAVRGDKVKAEAKFNKEEMLTAYKVLGRKEKPLEEIHETSGF
jgi:hypothetical protein